MRGMILAAGRGERMKELTQSVPKPLLKVAGKYLIEYTIEAMVKVGITDIVINVCYRREQIQSVLGNGSRYGAKFYFSVEEEALETGGGIFQALPLLGNDPFLVASSDVITDYPLQKLLRSPLRLAHLVLVENPLYHPKGDFSLQGEFLSLEKENTFTYSNVGIYRPELFANCTAGRFRLGDVLKKAIQHSAVTGEIYQGVWYNVGTPHELRQVDTLYSCQNMHG